MNPQKIKNLLKDPNTNWNYIVIIIVLSLIAGGGIWFCQSRYEFEFEIPIIEIPEKQEKILKFLYLLDKEIYSINPDGSELRKIAVLPDFDVVLIDIQNEKILMSDYKGLKEGLFIFNVLTGETKDIPELHSGQLFPEGNMIVYKLANALWLLDLEKDTKEKLTDSPDDSEIVNVWSSEMGKVYFATHLSRSGFRTDWFLNDRVYSVDIITHEIKIEADYSEICDEPFFIEPKDNGLFLAQCGKNFVQTGNVVIKFYNARNNTVTDLVTGKPFSEISNYILSLNGREFIYYDSVAKSMIKLDIFSGKKINLLIEQNQLGSPIYISPDGTYVTYILNHNTSGILYVYDLQNNQVINNIPGARFLGWIKETMVEDETVDWKTYRNDEYGFEIKYSTDWNSEEETKPQAYLLRKNFTKIDKSNGKIIRYGGETWPDYIIYITIEQKSSKSVSLEDIARGQFGVEIISSTKLGIPGVRYKILAIPSTTNEIIEAVIKGNYIYSVHFGGSGTLETDQKNIKIFDQILSTFRFVEDISNWKTYRNAEYGFEVKYPKNWYETHYYEVNIGGLQSIAEFQSTEEKLYISTGGPCPDCTNEHGARISISIKDNPQKTPVEEFAYLCENKETHYCETINVAGVNAVKRIALMDFGAGWPSVYVPKEDKIFVISYAQTSARNDYYLSVFNQALSTFRFIE